MAHRRLASLLAGTVARDDPAARPARAAAAGSDAIPSTMRALIKEGSTVSVKQVPTPKVAGAELLVRVMAAALNPTDLATQPRCRHCHNDAARTPEPCTWDSASDTL